LGLHAEFAFPFEEPDELLFALASADSQSVKQLPGLARDLTRVDTGAITTRPRICAIPRDGWIASADGLRISASSASVYVLNEKTAPVKITVRVLLSSPTGFSTLRLRLNASVLNELYLTGEQQERRLDCPPVFLPEGGHHLFFDLFPAGIVVVVRTIEITVEEAARRDLLLTLPFDLYQRYRLAARLVDVFRPSSVLDVGGVMGDTSGHLATTRDFLLSNTENQLLDVTVTDSRACDAPGYGVASAREQPYPDSRFDLVMSLDVLEHIPPEERRSFLEELSRLSREWILLGAPFLSNEVEAVEGLLVATSLSEQRFLHEHRALGLPDKRLVEQFCEEHAFDFISLPNGYLPRWALCQSLTQQFFALKDLTVAQTFNRLYNEVSNGNDQMHPAYRIVYVISKGGLTSTQRDQIESMGRTLEPEDVFSKLSAYQAFHQMVARILQLIDTRYTALSDAQFLANSREQLIRVQEEELHVVKGELAVLKKSLWNKTIRKLKTLIG